MCEVYDFPREMQPARPFPPPGDPRHQDVVSRTGELDVDPAPQHASTVLPSSDDPQFTPQTEDDWEKLAAHEGLYALIQKYGAQRVMTWVRSLAVIAGQEVN